MTRRVNNQEARYFHFVRNELQNSEDYLTVVDNLLPKVKFENHFSDLRYI